MAGARSQQPGHSLRSRILLGILAVTAIAMAAFGVPLGIVLARVEHDRVVLRLEREASQVLAQVPDEKLATLRDSQVPRTIPGSRDADDSAMRIGVYDAHGTLIAGQGPKASPLAARAVASARERTGNEAGEVTVALSLNADRRGSFAVRVAMSNSDVAEDAQTTGWLIGGLAAIVLLIAGSTAFLLARRLTRPLDALARSAHELGDGDFTVRTHRTGLREIDEVSTSLNATARRLGELLDRERAFSSNASHQIRTPLAALRLNLETLDVPPGSEAAAAIRDAVDQLDRLESTLDDLLALTRDIERPRMQLDVRGLLDDVEDRWTRPVRAEDRWLTVDYPDNLPAVSGSPVSLSHVLDVLIGNALQHGAGDISVSARDAGRAVAIDVSDQGAGITGDPDVVFERRAASARGHGIGLALARSLIEAEGGRLELTVASPHPVFSLVLPLSTRPDARRPVNLASTSK